MYIKKNIKKKREKDICKKTKKINKLFAGANQATGTTQTRIHRGKPGKPGLHEFCILVLLLSHNFNAGPFHN